MDEQLRKKMLSADFYPHHPPSVKEIQTHISHVFIAPPFVYKVKKPVDFGFLDFRTLSRRRFFTHREFYLNSRFSPGLYLDVLPITFDGESYQLSGEGNPVEYALKMRQFDGEKTMKSLIEKNKLHIESVAALARRLATLHTNAHRVSPGRGLGSYDSVAYDCRENFDQLAPFVATFINRDTYGRVKDGTLGFLLRQKDLFTYRHQNGFIRDCHGDLHTEHIIFEEGAIYIFDCIEFNERFRYIDVISDLAFLVMELEFMGKPSFNKTLQNTYFSLVGDKWGPLLLDFYACYRATVRAKVNAFTAADSTVPETQRERSKTLSRMYLNLADRLVAKYARPYLVITMGFSGTGKTTVAQVLREKTGIEVLRSDVIRKEMIYGKKEEAGTWNTGIYKPERRALVYEEMFKRARTYLSSGKSVCLDASFLGSDQRRQALQLSVEAQANLLTIECRCDEESVKSRLSERQGSGKDPSDADFAIYLRQKEAFNGWDPIPPAQIFPVDTTHGIPDQELSMLAALVT